MPWLNGDSYFIIEKDFYTNTYAPTKIAGEVTTADSFNSDPIELCSFGSITLHAAIPHNY